MLNSETNSEYNSTVILSWEFVELLQFKYKKVFNNVFF